MSPSDAIKDQQQALLVCPLDIQGSLFSFLFHASIQSKYTPFAKWKWILERLNEPLSFATYTTFPLIYIINI